MPLSTRPVPEDNARMSVQPGGDGAAASEPMSDAAQARRLQILSTEHWGLLAARSTAQSEVLSRITIFLAVFSAGLVTIGLLGQATAFSRWFAPAALALLAFLLVIGLLTQIRVFNVAEDDLAFVVAMNRIRTGYVDVDPGSAEYFLESTTDDIRGMQLTYAFLGPRSDASVILGGSAFLIVLVNACLAALLAGGALAAADAPLAAAITVGALAALVVLGASILSVGRSYMATWRRYIPRRMTARPPGHLRAEPRRAPRDRPAGSAPDD